MRNGRRRRDALRDLAASILRERRATGHDVWRYDDAACPDGQRTWECGEPEDCFMIPDTAGLLVLDEDASADDDEVEP